ncbi:unnamed protein product [Trichobilharzia regenti]|nr:unnamed protein product [Trichobilharzia regenti]
MLHYALRRFLLCRILNFRKFTPILATFSNIAAKPSGIHNNSSAFVYRSHNCGELGVNHVDTFVSLCGWVDSTRLSSRFLVLRDDCGLVQIYCDTKTLSMPRITLESVVKVTGKVKARPKKDINKLMSTGEIEVIAESVEVLNESSPLSFIPKEAMTVNEMERLKYRYLDLRSWDLQKNLRFRSSIILQIRNFLCQENGFVDIETPYLFKLTPGVSLTLNRFFLDIEMAFITPDDIYKIIENMLVYVWPLVQNASGCMPISTPFQQMEYSYAMSRYGSDKPDVRFGMLLSPVSDEGQIGFSIPKKYVSSLTAEDWDSLKKLVYRLTKQEISTFEVKIGQSEHAHLLNMLQAECGDLVIHLKGNTENELKTLGIARVEAAKLIHSKGLSIYEPGFHFLWVTQFPLFERNDSGQWTSVHHPFTAPTPETAHLLYTDPSQVIGLHYDLVCNGQEVGGGSIRVHNAEENSSEMAYFLTALQSGAPPHGGIALGLDRLISLFLNTKSIRDVIAFPKAADGKDLLCGTPTRLNDDVLSQYGICIVNNSNNNE